MSPLKQKGKKIEIYPDTTWYWNCPECGELMNQIDFDGDGFKMPVICNECKTEFTDYVNTRHV